MGNESNLKPLHKRTKSEQREIQQKGGQASGVSRRRRKSLQETAQLVAKLPLNDIGVNRLKRNGVKLDDVDPADVVTQLAIVVGIAGAAAGGDARAAKVFEDWLENADRHRREQADLEKKKKEIEKLQAEIELLKARGQVTDTDLPDDGFLEALSGSAAEDWEAGPDDVPGEES